MQDLWIVGVVSRQFKNQKGEEFLIWNVDRATPVSLVSRGLPSRECMGRGGDHLCSSLAVGQYCSEVGECKNDKRLAPTKSLTGTVNCSWVMEKYTTVLSCSRQEICLGDDWGRQQQYDLVHQNTVTGCCRVLM